MDRRVACVSVLTSRARPLRLLLALGVCAVAAAALALPGTSAAVDTNDRRAVDPAKGIRNLDHLVFIVQENRSFDHYFGTFPGANGIPRKPDGRFVPCLPDPESKKCRRPYHDTTLYDAGAAHSHGASVMSVNDGKMNGFVRALRNFFSICNTQPNRYECRRAKPGPNGQPDVMGFHTAAEIPNYWAYAKKYLLQDRMFAPSDTWTLPSHLYLVSAWSAACSDYKRVKDSAIGTNAFASSCRTNLSRPDQGWRPQQGAPRPYLWAPITWLLWNRGVSWAYYVGPGTCVHPPCDDLKGVPTAPVLNPLPGFRAIEKTKQFGRIKPWGDFFRRAASGTLPKVTWVVPGKGRSEHPPESFAPGQAWVTKLVNAIQEGPREQWMHTAIFVTWDDWGGFYDHVPPIRIDPYGYGIRVPAFVISPWVRRGLDVDHATYSFDAFLKLIEDRFLRGLRLNGQNLGWPDPRPTIRENRVPGDLRHIFNFAQKPIGKLILDPHP
jgi:phospholipase C